VPVKRTFTIKAIWDDEAGVFITESDIDGFHGEAAKLEKFQKLAHDLAIDLIVANHLTPQDLTNLPVKDLIPAIVLEFPARTDAAA